jgi:hypothetical protein
MWRTFRAAGRPWPVLSDDPVTDYMIMETVSLRVAAEDAKAAEDQKKEQWKEDKKAEIKQALGQE